MVWGDALLLGLSCLTSLPVLVLAVEVFAAILPRRRRPAAGARPRCTILVPAHNEAAGIVPTIELLKPQLQDGDRIIVIADNCADATAANARAAGAEAIERHDLDRRGKGFALDFGLKHLEADPPEIVVLIDADTRTAPEALDRLVRDAARRHTPVQGVFTDAPRLRDPRGQWSAFALKFKNEVRPLGLHHLGLSCLLYGSGMAFPYAVLKQAHLASGNIVEDMKLGIDLSLAGYTPRFCPDARFESDDAPTLEASATRRTRWEHGHVFTIFGQTPRLLWCGLKQCRPRLWALALELAVPPLSLLVIGQVMLLGICLIWWQLGGSFWPSAVIAGAGCLAAATILTAWARFGRQLLSLKILCMLPVYVLWKIPIYLKLVVRPERSWVRTERKPSS